MSSSQSFLDPAARRYLDERLLPPFPVMRRIEEEATKEGQPAVGRGTGSLLRTLVAATGGRRVLEVGTNLGYSGLWMASALRAGGHLDTIEFDAQIAERARKNFAAAGVGAQVTVHASSALDALPRLSPAYDLVFLDAAKSEYPKYFDHAARLLRPGGILAGDNAFWLGQAWDAKATDEDTLGIREFTRRALSDARFASTIVPSEDGLLVAVMR